ncbi:MAG: hypothetical protein RQ891_02475 [Thermoflexus sp.]|jgi:hypothetical protein|uniref:hypothetical protein n=1 Tax=Thermoflexus sp. TaxID=1969742 RepID=UPI002625B1DB|nr:hypothetical protein [Thermoflexus sp.]MDT7883707.1 hypothetical protein [Thermoflexus sp.]MDT7947379.1 hypothetical protein [Thermoflexus sp.]
MGRPEDPQRVGRVPFADLEWILEAFAPLRFPLAQGLWLLRPWIGAEPLARWIAVLESAPRRPGREDPR